MEQTLILLNNANELCENFNSSDIDLKLNIVKDPTKIFEFYKSYNGIKEFLYIAPKDEIQDAIESGSIFLGVYLKDELGGIVKLAQVKQPYPFFRAPKTMPQNGIYYGCSGLYVHEKFRGKGMSSILLDASTKLAEMSGASGIYADFDYRNIASMNLISKRYDLIGFTDGRNGSPDEATIYSTFFKDFTNCGENVSGLDICFDSSFDHARDTLEKTMQEVGKSSIYRVDYCGGYNEIACFDKPYYFESVKISHKKDMTLCREIKEINKNT